MEPVKSRTNIACALAIIMVALGLSASSARAALTDGLLGYWPFNGNAADMSGNGRDLQLFGGAGFGPGLIGQALALPGNSSSYAQRPVSDPVFDFGSSDFTIQAWFNFSINYREQTLVEKFTGCCGGGWTLTTPGGSDLQFYSQPVIVLNAGEAFTIGVWHQAIVRRSGSTIDMFFDGNLVATGTASGPLPSSPNPLLIGKRNPQDGRDFSVDGSLDEIAIWGRAVSNAEIAELYNGGQGMALAIPVTIEIKPPATPPVPINLSSAGVVPVAILSTPTFDATTVDPATVSLSGAAVQMIGKSDKFSCSVQDVDGDGLNDLVCQVSTVQFLIQPGQTTAVLQARTFSGQPIQGQEAIQIVP